MTPFLKYYFAALTKYRVHSPFVFEFQQDIFEDDRFYHFFGVIENYRRNLLGTADPIKFDQQALTVNQLVKKKAISARIGAILFKTVHQYKPDNLLEIGTSLGLATLYQATPNRHTPMITIEPNIEIAKKTQQYFNRLGTKNITLLAGEIDQNLPKVFKQFQTIEHLFFKDFFGKKATLNYFEKCLPYFVPNTVFIFNAPYASKETMEVWDALKKQKAVKLSIDIYHLGFLFFRWEQKEVAHYQLIESWKKPWAVF